MTSSRSRRRSRRLWAWLGIIMVAAILCQGIRAEPVVAEIIIPPETDMGQTIPVVVWGNPESDVMDVRISYRGPGEEEYTNVSMELDRTNGFWTYDIPAQAWSGILEWQITALDASGDPEHYPADRYGETLIRGESPPKTFPWSIAIMVAFLGVVLVLTELTFKPGFYRKTGRERARELEEEDRRREQDGENPANEGRD